MREKLTRGENASQFEDGTTHIVTGSGISEKSQDLTTPVEGADHPLEQELNLKYLGGVLELKKAHDV